MSHKNASKCVPALVWLLLATVGCGIIDAFSGSTSVDRPNLVPDGSGGAIVVYQVAAKDGRDTYVQRVGDEGNPMWADSGVPLYFAQGSGRSIGISAEMVSGSRGQAILAWTQYGGARLEAQGIHSDGRFM